MVFFGLSLLWLLLFIFLIPNNFIILLKYFVSFLLMMCFNYIYEMSKGKMTLITRILFWVFRFPPTYMYYLQLRIDLFSIVFFKGPPSCFLYPRLSNDHKPPKLWNLTINELSSFFLDPSYLFITKTFNESYT